MFLQVCVILFTGGEYLTRYTPRDQVYPPGQVHPPWEQVHPLGPSIPPGPGTPPRNRYTPRTRYTPPDQVHTPGPGTPPRHSMLGDTVYARAVRILLECNLVHLHFCTCLQQTISGFLLLLLAKGYLQLKDDEFFKLTHQHVDYNIGFSN